MNSAQDTQELFIKLWLMLVWSINIDACQSVCVIANIAGETVDMEKCGADRDDGFNEYVELRLPKGTSYLQLTVLRNSISKLVSTPSLLF